MAKSQTLERKKYYFAMAQKIRKPEIKKQYLDISPITLGINHLNYLK